MFEITFAWQFGIFCEVEWIPLMVFRGKIVHFVPLPRNMVIFSHSNKRNFNGIFKWLRGPCVDFYRLNRIDCFTLMWIEMLTEYQDSWRQKMVHYTGLGARKNRSKSPFNCCKLSNTCTHTVTRRHHRWPEFYCSVPSLSNCVGPNVFASLLFFSVSHCLDMVMKQVIETQLLVNCTPWEGWGERRVECEIYRQLFKRRCCFLHSRIPRPVDRIHSIIVAVLIVK